MPGSAALQIRVLLVDDRPENLVALHAVLEPEGYQLVDALSGKEAIAHGREHDFAAILLDVQMPFMDGFETAQRLRLHPRTRHVPILFVTAIDRTDAYERRGYDAGAVDYLFKPLNVDILRAKLKIFAELHRQREELAEQSQRLREHAVKERENELLRETLRQRDDFVSMASHELRTPITPLILQLQAFLALARSGKLRETDPARLERMLEISCSQVERLSRLTNELLDASRIATGQLQLNFAEVNLPALVEKLVEHHAPEAAMAGCEVRVSGSPPSLARADAFRAEQVFVNLLTNAFRYAPGRPISVRFSEEASFVLAEVEDQGPGISREDQARIFQRYERATSARHHGGLGLGLHIAAEIMRLHGGSISVLSEPGRGANFQVRFPRV